MYAPSIAARLVVASVVCGLACVCPWRAVGATIPAASAQLADVQAAINLTSTGDTVTVPAGTATWSSAILGVWRGITLQGAGTNSTIITVTRTDQAIYTQPGINNNRLRITGFTFNALDTTETVIAVNGPAYAVRVDNCHFNKGRRAVTFNFYGSSGPAYGVVDHCSFRNMDHPVYPHDRRDTDGFQGSVAWDEWNAVQGVGFVGTTNQVVVEDCHFIWDPAMTIPIAQGAVYGQAAGKVTFRYNLCNGLSPYLDAHGDGIGSSVYGTTLFEIYGNTMVEDNWNQTQGDLHWQRGGTFLMYSNVMTGVSTPLKMSVYFTSDIHRVTNSFYWGNTWNGSTIQSSQVFVADSGLTPPGYSAANIVEGTHYWLHSPTNGQKWFPYTPLTYPHPLTVTALSTLAVQSATYSINENVTPLTITLTRTGGSGAVSVNYATANGSAIAGVNYVSASGTVTWTAGDFANKTIPITIINDGVYSSDLTFTVTLSSPANAVLGSPNSTTATVVNINPPDPPEPPLMADLSWHLYEGQLSSPGTTNASGYFYQTIETDDPANAGCSEVRFTIPSEADYRIDIEVIAQASDRNSAFVAVTATRTTPVDPQDRWPITPFTGASLESRVVGLLNGGLGSPTNIWHLTPGTYYFAYCGREMNCYADLVTVSEVVSAPPSQFLSWSSTNITAAEDIGFTQFQISRTGTNSGTVSIEFYTENITALAGTHYTATNGTATLTNGVNSFSIPVTVIDNSVYGGNKTFRIVLTNATGATILNSPIANCEIIDDEIEQSVFWSSGVYVTNELSSPLQFLVQRVDPSGTVTVDYQTVNGTATAGVDYEYTSGTLTLSGAESSVGFAVNLIPNPAYTGDKYFQVLLTNPTNANIIGEPTTLGVILDVQRPNSARLGGDARLRGTFRSD